MKNALEEKRLRIVIPQLTFFLLIASYRIWSTAAHLKSSQAPPGSSIIAARHLGEFSNVSFSSSSRGENAALPAPAPARVDAHCASVGKLPHSLRCNHARKHCKSGRSIVNYVALHYCALDQRSWISVPLLLAAVLLAFFFLAETAEKFFSPVASLMVDLLQMSPTMGGVTLLALGNGAPDVFASMAAIGGGNSRIGLGAIISAGIFVSAFVVGSVALVAAPFAVKPLPFARDVIFYTTAVGLVFLVYLKGLVTFWQSLGLMSFYALFMLVVVVMDQLKAAGNDDFQQDRNLKFAEAKQNLAEEAKSVTVDLCNNDDEQASVFLCSRWKSSVDSSTNVSLVKRFKVIQAAMQAPLHAILRATVPEINASKWNRFYATANIVFCPLLLLFMFRSVISLDHRVVFFHPMLRFPVWCLVLVQNIFLASAFFITATKQQPPPEMISQIPVAFLAFVLSVFWISFIAGELLGCLAALGLVLGLSPALLGLTVLAWGNSMGDLVADLAIARAGKPEMAIAGCFAGPMFNLLVGLGFALVLHTSDLEPSEYYLPYHPSLMIAFGFLFSSLLGTLLVVALSKFQVTRFWGVCLIALYFIFTVVSLFSANSAH